MGNASRRDSQHSIDGRPSAHYFWDVINPAPLILLIGCLLLPLRVSALSPNLSLGWKTWEEGVLKADFVGVVEVTVAGGIVARYRVIDAWKGQYEEGHELSFGTPPDMWGNWFPIALCGERYLVVASSAGLTSILLREHFPSPLWRRDIPTDYEISWTRAFPVSQLEVLREDTRILLAAGPDEQEEIMLRRRIRELAQREDFADFRQKQAEAAHVGDLIRLLLEGVDGRSEEDQNLVKIALARGGWRQTLEILDSMPSGEFPLGAEAHAEVTAHLFREVLRRSPPEDHEAISLRRAVLTRVSESALPGSLHEKIENADRIEEIVFAVLDEARGRPEEDMGTVSEVLSAGRHQTLAILRGIPPESFPLGNTTHRFLLEEIERELHIANMAPSGIQVESTPEAIESYRDRLVTGNLLFEGMFQKLIQHDLPFVIDFLTSWEATPPAPTWGYSLVSAFVVHLNEDRGFHFESLLKAKDPFVRVGAATYLLFEDREKGEQLLRDFMELDGAPGAWAALNLARRGDKRAVPRVIEGMDYQSRDVFVRQRLLVLLSNSAATSGIPQPVNYQSPDWTPDRDGTRTRRIIQDWWNEHQNQIHLHDPWLEILEESKID